MDVNGTRYQLLLGQADWLACLDAGRRPLRETLPPRPALSGSQPVRNETGLWWDASRQELTLQKRLFKFTAARMDSPPAFDARRGAARDRFGNWYWIADNREEILVNSAGTGRTAHFWRRGEGLDCADRRGREALQQSGAFFPVDAPATPAPLKLSGLAVTEDHYLVVGVLEPKGLLVFDLHAGGTPQQILWPASVPFVPFDMAAAPGGGLFVLDHEHARYWTLDRRLNVLTRDQAEQTVRAEALDDFQPVEGEPTRKTARRVFPEGITLAASSPVAAGDCTAIEALPDGTVLILYGKTHPQDRFSLIRRYYFGEQKDFGGSPPAEAFSTGAALAWIEQEEEQGFTLVGHDFAFVPAATDRKGAQQDSTEWRSVGRLYVAAESGNQTFAFEAETRGEEFRLVALGTYLPMRLFGGKALVAAGPEVFYDFADRWIPLVEQNRPRYEHEAVFYTPLRADTAGGDPSSPDVRRAFDGREPECVWHRLLIDACIPPETSVEVWSRAADDERELRLAGWSREPRLYLRGTGTELPFPITSAHGATRATLPPATQGTTQGAIQSAPPGAVRAASQGASAGASQGASQGTGRGTTQGVIGDGTWELLFQRARGRYLQLRIRLRGNGRTTPRLRALRAYYPRFSYLTHYLPAVYREDASSASFLERFLANLEGFYTTTEDRIAAVQMLFDTRSAPQETLDWLANWFGVALDPAWDDRRRRLFIKHAMTFFQWRGTVRGLVAALRLVHDECVDESLFTEMAKCRCGAGRSRVRIVEKFLTRERPGVFYGDPTDLGGGADGPEVTRWLAAPQVKIQTPPGLNLCASAFKSDCDCAGRKKQKQPQQAGGADAGEGDGANGDGGDANAAEAGGAGADGVGADDNEPAFVAAERESWRRYLEALYAGDFAELRKAFGAETAAGAWATFADVRLLTDMPATAGARAAWVGWLDSSADASVERRLWQEFLARRYRSAAALDRAHATRWAEFRMVALPDRAPRNAVAARDWSQFVRVVLETRRTAHRFTVMLPRLRQFDEESAEYRTQRALTERVVNLEKPAHTVFDVKFYWAMFRVGEARLGDDTQINQGSRAPQLMPPFVVGEQYLSEGFLAPAHPQDVADRMVVGRDRVAP